MFLGKMLFNGWQRWTDLFGNFVKGNVVILPCKGKMRNLLLFIFIFLR